MKKIYEFFALVFNEIFRTFFDKSHATTENNIYYDNILIQKYNFYSKL